LRFIDTNLNQILKKATENLPKTQKT